MGADVRLPVTSAAPASQRGADPRAVRSVAEEIAVELESRRRTITLGGSLLFIPAAAGGVLAVSAALGVPMAFLPVCALIGLSIGPALTTASLALGNIVGLPRARRAFRKRALALGLPPSEVDETWRTATRVVEARARERISRGTRNAKQLEEGTS